MTERSDRVQRLMDDPDLKAAFEAVKLALLDKFSRTSTTDAESMLDIRKRLHLLESVKENLRIAIDDGKLEDFRVQEQEAPSLLSDFRTWKQRKKAQLQ